MDLDHAGRGRAAFYPVLAILCVLIARSRMKKSMFEATAAELKKDREWLKNLDKKRSLDELRQESRIRVIGWRAI